MRDAAAAISAASARAVEARGAFHLALSGGSTPLALYRLLATPDVSSSIEWPRAHAWWGDERDVPSDHPNSNFKAAFDALLSRVPIPAENIHRVRTELGATGAAEAYARDIMARVPGGPTLDLVLLGMGDDGHTASLFPGTVGALPADAFVAAHYVPAAAMWRVTFTPRLINAARKVVFLVSGAGKADMLWRILRGPRVPEELPSQMIGPVDGELMWMVDAQAARRLEEM